MGFRPYQATTKEYNRTNLIRRNDSSRYLNIAISEVEDYNAEATFYIGVNLQEEDFVRVEIVKYSGIVLVDFVLYYFEREQLSIGRLEEGLRSIGIMLLYIL